MSHLSQHLRARVRYLTGRIRSGLAIRHDRPWSERVLVPTGRDLDGAPVGEDTDDSPRDRLHHGLRSGIRKLRRARLFLAEFQSLQRRA